VKNIRFSRNWNNKLNSSFFSTIRLAQPVNLRYYLDKEGHVFNVLLKNKVLGTARLISVREVRLSEIPDELLILDTGLPPEKAIEIINGFYKNITEADTFNILIFERLCFSCNTK